MQIHKHFYCLLLLFSIWVLPAEAANSGEQPLNVLLICIDDLRPELGCYGVDYIRSPNIDSIASQGRLFSRHYVQAPTCGASRYALLTGRYGGGGNGALFQRAKKLQQEPDKIPPSLPAWFRQHGYTTVSVGKVSHHPGGRGGPDWNDPNQLEMPDSWDRHLLPAGPWQHPRGWMHGLANGEIRKNAKEMDVYQAKDGSDNIYPDGISVDKALSEIQSFAKQDRPFFLAVGILRPHLPFGAPAKYLKPYTTLELPPTPFPNKPKGKSTWHRSGEFMKYNRWKRDPNADKEFAIEVRKHYAACVSYADAQVGKIVQKLESTKQKKNTIIVIWGDHGWHLGEHAVWGKHTLFEESLRSPLIISYPGIRQAGKLSRSIVESIDLFPTLCELASLPQPQNIDGRSLKAHCDNPDQPSEPAISYFGSNQTIRTNQYRLIQHRSGYTELYDHDSPAKESSNVASEHSEVCQGLAKQLEQKLSKK